MLQRIFISKHYMKGSIIICTIICITMTTIACGQKNTNVLPTQHPSAQELTKYSQATFAAGCFWHEEALFESIKGVEEAVSGYAGGAAKNPSYETVETGNT